MSTDADSKAVQEEEDATELQFPKGIYGWNLPSPTLFTKRGLYFLNSLKKRVFKYFP